MRSAMNRPVFRVSGMILQPRFYIQPPVDVAAERERLGLNPELATALVLFGGHGAKVMEEIHARLDQSRLPLQGIFLCGKNERLAMKLTRSRGRMPIHVETFTKEVPYFMKLSDFFIGKPGPGSISEAIHMNLPVIVQRNAWTLPQERYNADWVAENCVGIVVHRFRDVTKAAARLLDGDRLRRYRCNAQAIRIGRFLKCRFRWKWHSRKVPRVASYCGDPDEAQRISPAPRSPGTAHGTSPPRSRRRCAFQPVGLLGAGRRAPAFDATRMGYDDSTSGSDGRFRRTPARRKEPLMTNPAKRTFGPLAPPQRLLMGPGPTTVEPRVYEAMSTPIVSHVDAYFFEVAEDIRELLQVAFGTENASLWRFRERAAPAWKRRSPTSPSPE